jgi:tetratricopeptide (TPR) repeat protein
MESQARVREAETFIKNYEKVDPYQSFSDLAALYERNMQKDPLSPEWPYKLGLINYEKASNPAVAPMLDTIVYFPIINKEIFLGIDERNNLLTRSKESQIENEFGVKTEAILSPLHISTNTITIYITDETVFLSPIDVYTPRKKAVEYLLKASQLIGDPQLLGDINFKIGNVYVWAGSNKNAYTYYEKAIGYQPDNAAFHLKMVDVANTLYKNSKAYESLDHLYKQNQINFPGTMLFATYNIHSGKFDLAEKLLNDAESVYPYNLPAIIDLRGRMMLLSKRSKEAIKYYQLYLTKNKDDANTMYSIARAYQMQGNKAVAWKWLTDALKNGFNYYFVVRFDPTWAAESNTPKWKKLLSDMKLARKFYPDEKSGAINLNSPGP